MHVWGIFGSAKGYVFKKPTVVSVGSEVVDFVLGDLLTVFLTKKGEVFTLGDSTDGQLGIRVGNLPS